MASTLRAGARRLLVARAQPPAATNAAAAVGKRGLASAEPAAAKSSRAEELMHLEVGFGVGAGVLWLVDRWA